MKNEPKLPTLVALVLLFIGIGATIFLIENYNSTVSQAKGTSIPTDVNLTNVTDNSFSISWITDEAVTGLISYQEKTFFTTLYTAFDKRDFFNRPTPRVTHFIDITNLKPKTTYEVTIISGNRRFKDSRFVVTTGQSLLPPSYAIDPAFGTVLPASNNIVPEALIYASFEDSQKLGTVVSNDGRWLIPLGTLRSLDLSRYFIPQKDAPERLLFIYPKNKSSVTTTIENDSPLPPVRLGENYDFRTTRSKLKPVIAQTQTFSTIATSVNTAFTVTAPTKGAFIPSSRPAFTGSGIPGKKVIITVSEKPVPVAGETVIALSGKWSWTPPRALSPGKHTATFTSYTQTGSPLATSVSFTVLKSGTQVLGDATPSASLTPSPRVASATPTATPILPTPGTGGPTIYFLGAALILVISGSIFLKENVKL